MAVLNIEYLGSDVLRQRAEEIGEITAELRTLVQNMFQTMYEAEGVGLAGPQVGVSQRVIVVDVREEGSSPFALINPKIVQSSRDTEKAEEGCLSIPGVSGVVERPAHVVVEGLNELGQPLRIEAEGLLGRCLQHEVDHLDGVLFIDRLSPLKRTMVLKKYRSQQAAEATRPRSGSRSSPRG